MNVALWIGVIAAFFSCVSGFLLSLNSGNEPALEERHLISGLSLFVFSVFLLIVHLTRGRTVYDKFLYSVLFILMVITGHLGGSLTHGEDYLSEAWNSETVQSDEPASRKQIVNIDSALVYSDIIQPLLQEKCYSCHGKGKRKGGLKMDKEETLMKGGKDGIVLVHGMPEKSELVKRIELPRNHDDHMPPKEKPQLTEQELKIIHWWVASGAGFDKKSHQVQQTTEIKNMLREYQEASSVEKTIPAFPVEPIKEADRKDIDALKELGIVVTRIGTNNNYLSVNLMNAELSIGEAALLTAIKKQMVWLRAGNKSITDSMLIHIGRCVNLRRLQLDHSQLTNNGVKHLVDLKELQYLNLVGTSITVHGLLFLKNLKNLQTVYCYQTGIRNEDLPQLKNLFPNTVFDLGGYLVPTLPGDTTEVK